MQKEQAKLVNAQSPLRKGTRLNSYETCAQTYMIKLFEFSTFYVFLDFLLTQNKSIKVRSIAKIKTMHIKRCMMHKCMIMKYLMHEESCKERKN